MNNNNPFTRAFLEALNFFKNQILDSESGTTTLKVKIYFEMRWWQ